MGDGGWGLGVLVQILVLLPMEHNKIKQILKDGSKNQNPMKIRGQNEKIL